MRHCFFIYVIGCVIALQHAFVPADDVIGNAGSFVGKTPEKSREVLADVKFADGFVLTGATHEAPKRIETFGQNDVTPAWQIAQWHSRGLLDRVQVDDKTVKMTDDDKSVTLDRKTGAINLTVHASKEYDKPRTSPLQPWVHLLLEQSPFRKPVNVADAAAIWVEVEFELTENTAHGPQNPALHTAQVSWFFYLKNTNEQSKGFRDFLWFGVSMFDSRYDFVPDYAAQDFAVPSGSFIYNLGSKRYFDEPVKIGKRQTIRRDILPDIRQAIDTAHERGFIVNTTLNDIVLDGTNIGWEVPGTYDAGITLHKLSVTVEESQK
ncbi:MAG: hypothetical protein FWC50_08060 [Planctomycetaceae bacterium]|nr:hypothetical protein [Planctomycetaceae bacterium]